MLQKAEALFQQHIHYVVDQAKVYLRLILGCRSFARNLHLLTIAYLVSEKTDNNLFIPHVTYSVAQIILSWKNLKL